MIWMWMAFAQDVPDPAVQAAEYRRVSEELQRAAKKNAWKGVERNYQRALATGVKVQAADHVTAALGAKHHGDLGAVRVRMLAALAVQPTNEVALAEVMFLDANYARVDLKAASGALLEDYERPFDPLKLKAVDHAIAVLDKTGIFLGLLPPGAYALNADPFELRAGQVFSLDLRPPPPPPPAPVPLWRR